VQDGGDAPPRPECAPLWRDRLLAHTPELRLTLLVGAHAQTHALGAGKMIQRVMSFREHLPATFRCRIHPGGAIIGRCRIHGSRSMYYPR
jgi:uracil-DNA glycosylase